MGKRKTTGFTLVELLAVIVLLTIILLIAIPSISSIVSNAKNDTYENQLLLIKNMAKTYSSTTIINYDENKEAYFTLGDMIELGVAPESITDPRCGKNFMEDTLIKATYKNSTAVIEIEEILTACDLESPIITSITTTSTFNTITIAIEASTLEGSIKEYYYSIDDGQTWVSAGSNSDYTFIDLESETSYSIKVKVKNTYSVSKISDTYIETTLN